MCRSYAGFRDRWATRLPISSAWSAGRPSKPLTSGLQSDRSSTLLFRCLTWYPRQESNLQVGTRFERAASAYSATGAKLGGLPRIRTETGCGLSAFPLPSWDSSPWCAGRESNPQGTSLSCWPLCQVCVPARGTPATIRTPKARVGAVPPHHRQPGRMVGAEGLEPSRAETAIGFTDRRRYQLRRYTPNSIVKELGGEPGN
jgi:hypothetical protein